MFDHHYVSCLYLDLVLKSSLPRLARLLFITCLNLDSLQATDHICRIYTDKLRFNI